MRAVSDTLKSKLVFAPDGFDVGAAQRNRGLGGHSTLDALCTRSSRSFRNVEVEGRQVFSQSLSEYVGFRAAHVDVLRYCRN